MESVGDPRSTIDKEIAAFDAEPETAFAESTIRELISTYPDNQDVRHILVKAIAINAVYQARVLDTDLQPLSIHMKTIDELDARLRQGLRMSSMRFGNLKEQGVNIFPSLQSSAVGITRKPTRSTTSMYGKRFLRTERKTNDSLFGIPSVRITPDFSQWLGGFGNPTVLRTIR